MIEMSADDLRRLATRIWSAGVAAVAAERLVRKQITVDSASLHICGHAIPLASLNRLCVVGAGKAGAGMAAGVEAAVGERLLPKVEGWVNVPADCVRPLQRIHLHPARPAGINEPTSAGVEGTDEILQRVSQLGPKDVCLVLISGGGSALLPAPIETVSLEEKVAVTRFLSASGASIQELNAVRRVLSRVKGGGLARASRAGTTIALVISDVIGDPLPLIASGPTVVESIDRMAPLETLERFDPKRTQIPESVWDAVERAAKADSTTLIAPASAFNHVIGNNRAAVQACVLSARTQGISDVRVLGVDQDGVAASEGRTLARECLLVRDAPMTGQGLTCLLSGGEPVVRLNASAQPRKGGRNQELVLAAAAELWTDGGDQIVVLSGGTDGEDGPTDAAGAVVDHALIERAKSLGLHPQRFLANNDSYHFFDAAQGLLKTGPTHTNVMDVRVAIIQRGQARVQHVS
jgi:hydroxypyruvate reductase